MPFALEPAVDADASELAALHNAVADDLTARFGKGHWSGHCTERGVRANMRAGRLYVMRRDGTISATLRLSTKKPWAIDTSYFTECQRPLYLLDMAVVPKLQRQGIGRRCIDYAKILGLAWPSESLRLDAYDSPAGGGGFYERCGFDEMGRVTYRGTPLVYFEMLL